MVPAAAATVAATTETVTLRLVAPAFAFVPGLAALATKLRLALAVAGTAIVALEAAPSAAAAVAAAMLAVLAVVAGFVTVATGLRGLARGIRDAKQALQPAEEAAGLFRLRSRTVGGIWRAGLGTEVAARFARIKLLVAA